MPWSPPLLNPKRPPTPSRARRYPARRVARVNLPEYERCIRRGAVASGEPPDVPAARHAPRRVAGDDSSVVGTVEHVGFIQTDQPADVTVTHDTPRRMAGMDRAAVVTYQPAGFPPPTQWCPRSQGASFPSPPRRLRLWVTVPRFAPASPPTWTSPRHAARRPAAADDAVVATDQPADTLPAGHVHVAQRDAADGAGRPDRAEQPRVVAAVDEQVGGACVRCPRTWRGRPRARIPKNSSYGTPMGSQPAPSFHQASPASARPVPVGVEVQVVFQLVTGAARDAAAEPGQGRRKRRRERRRFFGSIDVVRPAVAVQVVAHRVELRERLDLYQSIAVRVVVVPHPHREALRRARGGPAGIDGRPR